MLLLGEIGHMCNPIIVIWKVSWPSKFKLWIKISCLINLKCELNFDHKPEQLVMANPLKYFLMLWNILKVIYTTSRYLRWIICLILAVIMNSFTSLKIIHTTNSFIVKGSLILVVGWTILQYRYFKGCDYSHNWRELSLWEFSSVFSFVLSETGFRGYIISYEFRECEAKCCKTFYSQSDVQKVKIRIQSSSVILMS